MQKKMMMLGVLALSLAATTSCKKEYTCRCTIKLEFRENSSSPWFPLEGKSENTKYSAKYSEKQAKAACDHAQTTHESTLRNSTTENGTQPDPDTRTSATCVLQ